MYEAYITYTKYVYPETIGQDRQGVTWEEKEKEGIRSYIYSHMPGTLQDTLYTLAKSLPIASPFLSKIYHLVRQCVPSDGIMPEV